MINGGLFFMVAIFLQRGLGFSPFDAGLTFCPIGGGFLIGSLASPRLVKRLGRNTLSIGYAVAIAGLAFSELSVHLYGAAINISEMALPFLIISLGFGLGQTPLVGTVLAGIKKEDTGIASGLLSTAIQLGITIGVGLYGTIFYSLLANSSSSVPLVTGYLDAFEAVLYIFIAAEILNFALVFLLPKPPPGQPKDIFLDRLPGPLTGLAAAFYFMSGGRVGKPLFDDLIGETAKRRSQEIRAPVDDFPGYIVKHFTETNREDPEWIQFLTREALDPKGKFITLKEEREKLIRSFVDDIKERQEKGYVDRSIDPNNLALMIFALSFYPRVFAAVTKTVTGLSPTDPQFEKRWSEFLNALGHRFEEHRKDA
jgi:Tetracyclin repressor-like, C-terminal domain